MGRGEAWRQLRLEILDRDGWRCRACGKAGKMEVDHITPLRRGGAELDPGNLQALCRSCHAEKSKREARRESAGQRAWRAFLAASK